MLEPEVGLGSSYTYYIVNACFFAEAGHSSPAGAPALDSPSHLAAAGEGAGGSGRGGEAVAAAAAPLSSPPTPATAAAAAATASHPEHL